MELPLKRVEEFLHQRIPLSKALNCTVEACSNDSLSLSFPKFANTIEQDRYFDGCLSLLGALAAWTLAQVTLRRLDYEPATRIVRSEWISLQPAVYEMTTIRAVCSLPGDREWQQFLRMLSRKAVATVALQCSLENEAGLVAKLTCELEAHDLDHC